MKPSFFERIPEIVGWLLRLFLIVFPFQTVWIFREAIIGGSKWEYGTQGFFASELIVWASVFLWGAWYIARIRQREIALPRLALLRRSPDRLIALAALFLALFSLAAVFWSLSPALALQTTRYTIEAILLFFLFLTGPLSVAVALNWLLVSAALQSGIAALQFIFQASPSLSFFGMSAHRPEMAGASIVASDAVGRVLRGYGAFPHPNILGGFLAMTITLFLLAARRLSVRSWMTVGIITLLFIGLFVSFSRAAWIAVLFTLALSLIFFERRDPRALRHPSAMLIGLAIFTLLIGTHLSLIQTRFSFTAPHEKTSTEERVEGIGLALRMFADHPIRGIGPGQYTALLAHRFPALSGWQLQPVHASGLLFVAERGLIGLLFLSFFFFSFWRLLFASVSKKERSNVIRMLVIAAMPLVVLGSVDHYLVSHLSGLFVAAIFLAIVGRLIRETTETPQ